MKAYKLEVLVIDHEDMGAQEIINELENVKYSMPQVKSIFVSDIGEWDDNHPLNRGDTYEQAYLNLVWEKI